ncbi:MAG: PSD1 and planctomycete cytochrome C domain-containing protein [Pirellulales bacterium]
MLAALPFLLGLSRRFSPIPTLAACFLVLSPVVGSAQPVSFSQDVQPLLAKRCYACHGPDVGEGGLHLHQHDPALAELESGAHAIVPGKPEASELLARVSSEDESMRMPPDEKPLSAAEIDILRRWIADGAKWEGHWAFAPLTSPTVPAVENAAWVRNPIDAFILAKLEARGLEPAAPADRRTLARRLYYDLTGLPPSPEALARFVDDDRPEAYEQLVDELLNSPQYGERWARHWLDLVRYAETNSFERDGPKPNAWKYRDYVIRSLNADKPYDQFVREQLAGDELAEVTPETITATGFYRLGTWDDEPADPVQSFADEIDSLVGTVGQVFLSLTVNCARCHDHKIDPIPQTDYYGMVAFFADVTTYGTRADEKTNSQWNITPPEVSVQVAAVSERAEKLKQRREEIEKLGIVRMAAQDQRKTEGEERAAVLAEKLPQLLTPGEYREYQEVVAELEAAEAQQGLPQPESILALATCEMPPPATHVHQRGNPHSLGEVVEPRYPELFGDSPPEIPLPADGARSAGRRRVLADWITSPDNRLTPRSIANRVWQHHFGRGIVRSANNFGQLGTPPTHPELLDWLAQWLVAHDWRLKPLHRLMVTSSAYRMSSLANPQAMAVDPANDLFWRFDMRRLGAEEIRDTVLATTGKLNLAMFGPSIYPELSTEVLATQSEPGKGWDTSSPEEQARRSIYIYIKRSLIPPALTAFDFPDTDTSCEARFITTGPAQALSMVNGEFLNEQAGLLAERVVREAGEELRRQVSHALQLALGREPREDEIADGVELIELLQAKHGKDKREALRYWCLTVLNLNEYVYLD